MVAEIASVVAPVFLVALIGFIWARVGGRFDGAMITALVMAVGTPSLVVDTFLRVRPSTEAFGEIVLAAIALFAGFALLSFLFLKLVGWSLRDYMGGLMFPNCGNMGLPLSLFAFGEQGLALAIVIFAISAIGNFTIGTSIAAGTIDPRAIARMPIIYAVIISLVILLTGFQAPEWLGNTLKLLGGLTIPLMLLALGVSLSRLRPEHLWKSLLLAVVRIASGFGVGLFVAWAFQLGDAARGVVVLQASMPSAVFNYLFAERYGRDAPGVAGLVLVSTLLSFGTLPLLLWFLL
ncbi:MAG TPA: AEC family transporter [Kiloniellales bacterium]|nr:AEC family transporter [Kiloniellales bacterium]